MIAPGAYISEHAIIIGDVSIQAGASIWPGVVIRGDNEKIEVGEDSNVQDGAVLHADAGYPLIIGRRVSVGHQAMLHGCIVGDNSLVGIQAVVLNGASIGPNSLVGAASLLGEGRSYPGRSLVIGAPAKVIRELTDDAIASIRANAFHYRARGQSYEVDLERIG